jgi:hypothetical protein
MCFSAVLDLFGGGGGGGDGKRRGNRVNNFQKKKKKFSQPQRESKFFLYNCKEIPRILLISHDNYEKDFCVVLELTKFALCVPQQRIIVYINYARAAPGTLRRQQPTLHFTVLFKITTHLLSYCNIKNTVWKKSYLA